MAGEGNSGDLWRSDLELVEAMIKMECVEILWKRGCVVFLQWEKRNKQDNNVISFGNQIISFFCPIEKNSYPPHFSILFFYFFGKIFPIQIGHVAKSEEYIPFKKCLISLF